jgi:8-oxo-dGTP diphosphatase
MDLRVAAYAVVTDEAGRVLLARWNPGQFVKWTLPGGGMEPGEHPEDAAVREVYEETGYEIALDGLIGVDSGVIPGHQRIVPAENSLQALRIVYRAHVIGGELTFEADGSTDMAAWVEPHEVATLDRVSLVEFALGRAGIKLD